MHVGDMNTRRAGMRKWDKSKQGLAAVEFAMLLPILVLLLFFLVEGANAMHTYSSLVEASREGARLVLLNGETAEVKNMIESLSSDLDTEFLTTAVKLGSDTVTVEVYYDYEPVNENIYEMLTGKKRSKFAASTTMPMP